MTYLGSRLRELRIARGMSMRDVADRALVGIGQIHRLETGGIVNPTAYMLLRLGTALDVSPVSLMRLVLLDLPDLQRGRPKNT